MKLAAAILFCAACALPAGDPAGFYIWKSAELKGFAKTLAPIKASPLVLSCE